MTSLILAGTLSGCVETTQQKSARAKVTADRLLASQNPVRVTRPNPDVSVLVVGRVTSGDAQAIGVTLRNDTPRPLSDVPISVGVIASGGHRVYLNSAANLPYFQTHVGAIAPGASTTWVFTARGRSTAAGPSFAIAGVPTVTDEAGIDTLPVITTSSTPPRRGSTQVTITNRSGVPQTGLAVYAAAFAGRRLIAAGQTALIALHSSATTTIAINLVGNAAAVPLQLDAPPTDLR